ncbi:hypothetical protein Agabi119p4_3154 [Agaricus bisporus var. burnettii]|uniref:Probable transporter MCH1 n=1 Tax=Agaricus bisporus var. burnettii TaxID=192524 RepID=A0A8H7KJ11_AGABI|nr:hypothetical protein Agabi119p4_3154 [Agaricus bisporus var. burnettii]
MASLCPSRTTSVYWKSFACCSIVANALCSGGIFTFPLMLPVLADRCRLTQPQLTTVVLAAMMGQYPFAAFAGKLIDYYGPSLCSAIAAILYSSAFSLFSYHSPSAWPAWLQYSRTFLSSLQHPVCSLSNLVSHPVLAWHFSAFLLFFSLTSPRTGLRIVIRALSKSQAGLNSKDEHTASRDPELPPSETSQLLPRGEYTPELHAKTDSTRGLLTQGHFWLLILFCICVFGASEMAISNIGTIVAALPSSTSAEMTSDPPSTMDSTPQQVRLISMANTFTRILVGPLADYVSPVASYLPNGTIVHARKYRISRVFFLFVSAIILSLTFLWTSIGITTQSGIWLLSLGTGIGYSATFTVIPSIVSSVWGLKHLGRNFGILMYAPFAGTPMFSYLYAFVSQSHSTSGGICRGTECWKTTFRLTSFTSLLAVFIALALWRQWRGRL